MGSEFGERTGGLETLIPCLCWRGLGRRWRLCWRRQRRKRKQRQRRRDRRIGAEKGEVGLPWWRSSKGGGFPGFLALAYGELMTSFATVNRFSVARERRYLAGKISHVEAADDWFMFSLQY